jgi:nickel/cobalt exporter
MLLSVSFPICLAQGNPFVSTTGNERKSASDAGYPKFVMRAIAPLIEVQKNLYERMAELVELAKSSRKSGPIAALVGICFLYGAVHALGPGHGKTILVSYFVGRPVPPSLAFLTGGLIAFVHTGSAILVVVLVSWIIRHSFLASLENVSRMTRIVSHALITVIGVWLVVAAIRGLRKKGSPAQGIDREKDFSYRGLFSVVMAVGIVPCPGALLILLFSLSLEVLPLGILLALVMAAGIGISISVVGSAAIAMREGITRLLPERSSARWIFEGGLRLLGSLLIGCLGLFLLLGS